jgi:hypothetical protein
MISVKKCRELLGERGKDLSDKQIEAICYLFSSMARINVKIINQQKTEKK